MTDSFGARKSLTVGSSKYQIYRLDAVAGGTATLPYTLKILLENLLRFEDGENVTAGDIRALADWDPKAEPDREIAFTPARVLLQDFTGVPAVVDLAAMRDALAKTRRQTRRRSTRCQPVELVIDHSVQVDDFGTPDALAATTRSRVRAQPGALRVPALGAERVPELPRRAAGHRHRAPGEPRVPGARRVRAKARRRRSPIPTRWSAPTRTRR